MLAALEIADLMMDGELFNGGDFQCGVHFSTSLDEAGASLRDLAVMRIVDTPFPSRPCVRYTSGRFVFESKVNLVLSLGVA